MLKYFFLLLISLPAFAGDSSFWVWDLTVMPPGFRQPQFTRAAEAPLGSSKLVIWVEENLGEHNPSRETLDALVTLFAKQAPAGAIDRTKGIVELERSLFGSEPTPPSKNRDLNLVIAAIPPYEKHGQKFGFDGFFNVYDQLTEAKAKEQEQHSNERNIIYVNALQDLGSDYMRAVVAHELNHLLTYGQFDADKDPLDPWVNEMLGEAAMQLTGYFTDVKHVQKYRENPEWPLAVMQYGISYGGLSLFAEYLMSRYDRAALGRLAPATGSGFARLEAVYGKPWSQLFGEYASWLFQETSQFPGAPVAVRAAAAKYSVAPSGVLYLPQSIDPDKLVITTAPQGCSGSKNVVKSSFVYREDADAQAVWVESNPPCAADRGESKFDAFTLETK